MKTRIPIVIALALLALSTLNSLPRRNAVKAGQLAATWLLALLLLAAINASLSTCFAQGSLTPPGAPAPTMLTLNQIEPRTPISSAPFTITNPGSYYLTTNVSVTSGNAITVSANNVTLDLNGFTIFSTENPAVSSAGISLGAVTNIAIYNGHISSGVADNAGVYSGSGFGLGIFGSGFPYNVRVSDVSVSGCQYDGIYLASTTSTVVESCVVNTVGAYGIVAQSVSDSTANDCGTTAISATTANNCYGSSSGSGSGVSASTANNCYGASAGNGNGVDATIAVGCSGSSSGSYGVNATTANNCYGSSSDSSGVNANAANNCYGTSSSSVPGLFAFTANNCYGSCSSSGAGLFASTANNCYGYNTAAGTGLYATYVAIGCFGYSSSGVGLNANIANSCYGATSSGTAENISFKYNMP